MKTLSLKIDETIFSETERIVSQIAKPRNRYINEAIDHYNKVQARNLIEEQLKEESFLVRDESISVLKEFESLGYED